MNHQKTALHVWGESSVHLWDEQKVGTVCGSTTWMSEPHKVADDPRELSELGWLPVCSDCEQRR